MSIVFLFLIAILQVQPVHAYANIVIEPAVAGDPGSMDSREGTGQIRYDIGTLTFPTGTYSARGEANDITGVLKVYAAATQTQGAVGVDPLFAGAVAGVNGDIKFIGIGSDPVLVTLSMDFDGKFFGTNVYNNLTGDLQAFIGNDSWGSILQFIQDGNNDIQANGLGLKTTSYGSVSSHSPFPEGDPLVISSDPTALQGRVILPLWLSPGQTVELSAMLSASSGAIPDENMNWTGTFDSMSDGFNTARLSFSVPTGYSFIDDRGENLFSGVSVSAVPEPYTYMMLLAGLGIIGTIARKKSAAFI
jgi:hypothetical protein